MKNRTSFLHLFFSTLLPVTCHLFTATCLLLPATLFSQATVVTNTGIGGGGALFSPVIDPHNTNRLFMACDMTELFFSDDDGLSWDFYAFQDLVAFPNSKVQFTEDPNVLYCLHHDYRNDYFMPVRSTDGGSSWSPLNDPSGNYAWQMLTDPNDQQRLLINDGTDLHFSSSGALNWTVISTASPGEMYLAGAFWDGDSIFIGTRNGMIYSTNGGSSFQPFTNNGLPNNSGFTSFSGARNGNTTRLAGITHDLGSVYTEVQAYDFYDYQGIVAIDYGVDNSWQNISPPPGSYFFHCAMQPSDTGVIYAGATSGNNSYIELWKSTNGGTSWTNTFQTTDNTNIAAGWCGEGSENNWWYAEVPMGLAVDPNDVNHVVFTDFGFVHISNDGGNNWRQAYVTTASQNPPGADIAQGLAYTGVLENTTCWDILQLNDTLFASFGDIAGIASEDGGNSWSYKRINDNYNSNYLIRKHPSQNILYAATASVHDLYQSTYISDSRIGDGSGEISFSTDKGITWQVLHNFNDPVIWFSIDPTNNDIMYASIVRAGAGGIYKTTNLSAGANSTWQKVTEPPRTEDHPFVVQVLNDGHVVCTYSANRTTNFTQSSGVFYSTDGGNTWLDRSDTRMHYWTKDVVIDPHDPSQNTWYACVFTNWGPGSNNQGGVYRTTDRGQNWTKLEDFFRCESISIDPQNPDKAYVTTEDEGLWETGNLTNSNPTFTQASAYKFQHPTRVFFDAADPNVQWITSFGNGISGMEYIPDFEVQENPGETEISLYPNPVGDYVNICSEEMIQEISFITVSGQILVRENVNEMNYRMDVKGFAPGYYLVEIKTEQGVQYTRMVRE